MSIDCNASSAANAIATPAHGLHPRHESGSVRLTVVAPKSSWDSQPNPTLSVNRCSSAGVGGPAAGLSLVVSGDVVYNRTHMWLAGSTPQTRASWARALDAVAALEAGTLIAGHRDPRAGDDDARRQIGECRRYLADFEAALERSSAAPGPSIRCLAALIDRRHEAPGEPGGALREPRRPRRRQGPLRRR